MSKIFDDEDYAWGLLEKLLETRNESTKFRSTNQYRYMKSKIRAGNTRKTNNPSKPKKPTMVVHCVGVARIQYLARMVFADVNGHVSANLFLDGLRKK